MSRPRKTHPSTCKKRQRDFNAAAPAVLRELGAVENTGKWKSMYSFTLETPQGALLLKPDSSTSNSGILYSVFARWDDVDVAKSLGGNPFSGKWNFHMSIEDGMTVEAALASLRGWLEWGIKAAA